MQVFRKHAGLVVAIDRANIDTDQIIPKQFLKRIERTGFGQFLFYDWRFLDDGTLNSDFELNRPEFAGASVLLTRRNFGCGSSLSSKQTHRPPRTGDSRVERKQTVSV